MRKGICACRSRSKTLRAPPASAPDNSRVSSDPRLASRPPRRSRRCDLNQQDTCSSKAGFPSKTSQSKQASATGSACAALSLGLTAKRRDRYERTPGRARQFSEDSRVDLEDTLGRRYIGCFDSKEQP